MVKDASKNKTQKLIIPKGTIDSTDTTIIEIPVKLHSQPVVVAKRKTSEKSLFLDGNREAITFRPHHTLLEPESFTEFNEKIVGHQSTMLEDNRPRGAQVSRTGFSDGFHQRPVFRFDERPFPNDYIPHGLQPTDPADVDEIEKAETQLILEELQKYHQARRRFLEDASAIATKSKLRIPRQSDEAGAYGTSSRSYESPSRDGVGPCGRHQEPPTKINCPHCTESQSSRKVSTVYQKVPCNKKSTNSINSTSSMDCRACCSLTEKAPGPEQERQRPGLLSTQDLCEIATQFREARKKLDKVIAQASLEADCSSGNTLQPCLKHNRPDNGSESKPHSNVQKQSKPRELDPLLVSRELQTGTRDRPLERRRSNRGEEVRYEREMQTVERRRSKNDDFDEFRCAAGGTSTPIPSKRTQQVDAVDSADSLLGDDEPEGKIVTDNLMDDKLPKKSSKSSSAFRDREEEPNVQDRAKKFTPLTETPTMLAPQEIVKRSSLSSKSRISSVTAEDDEDEVKDIRQSRVETKPQEQARSSKSSRFQTSQYADDDNDDAEDIRKSGFETRVSYRPTPKKSDCATCCRLIGDFPEMNKYRRILESKDLFLIKAENLRLQLLQRFKAENNIPLKKDSTQGRIVTVRLPSDGIRESRDKDISKKLAVNIKAKDSTEDLRREKDTTNKSDLNLLKKKKSK
ncbi:uncharacterized protein isoform X2 [Leptinotarsa decemlineata]|uniref:uncharacterized protein isoform X2 n=1 Tax=Leptinotarsa decemlineata TaxID=7539 RepID=UPI003D306894